MFFVFFLFFVSPPCRTHSRVSSPDYKSHFHKGQIWPFGIPSQPICLQKEIEPFLFASGPSSFRLFISTYSSVDIGGVFLGLTKTFASRLPANGLTFGQDFDGTSRTTDHLTTHESSCLVLDALGWLQFVGAMSVQIYSHDS